MSECWIPFPIFYVTIAILAEICLPDNFPARVYYTSVSWNLYVLHCSKIIIFSETCYPMKHSKIILVVFDIIWSVNWVCFVILLWVNCRKVCKSLACIVRLTSNCKTDEGIPRNISVWFIRCNLVYSIALSAFNHDWVFSDCFLLYAVCVARGLNWVLYGPSLQRLRTLFLSQAVHLLKELLSKGLIPSHGWQTITRNFCAPKVVALTVGPFLALQLMESRTRFHRSVLSWLCAARYSLLMLWIINITHRDQSLQNFWFLAKALPNITVGGGDW